MQLNPYLTFDGRCEEAFKFYAKVLGGEISAMIPHEGTPAEAHVPAEWRKKIMHARLLVDGEVLMGSDAPPGTPTTWVELAKSTSGITSGSWENGSAEAGE